MNNFSSLIAMVKIPKELFFNDTGNWYVISTVEGPMCVPVVTKRNKEYMYSSKRKSVYDTAEDFYETFLVELFKSTNPDIVSIFEEVDFCKDSEKVIYNIDKEFTPMCSETTIRRAVKEVMLRKIVHYLYKYINPLFIKGDLESISRILQGTAFQNKAMEKINSYKKKDEVSFKDFLQLDYCFLQIFEDYELLDQKISESERLLLSGDFIQGVNLIRSIHSKIVQKLKDQKGYLDN